MIIGVPKEVKNNESRAGLTPESVDSLVKEGHEILVQKDGYIYIKFLTQGI